MAGKSGKSAKAGRNQIYCKYYKTTHRREKNKIIRVKKHLVRHPTDASAIKCAEALDLML